MLDCAKPSGIWPHPNPGQRGLPNNLRPPAGKGLQIQKKVSGLLLAQVVGQAAQLLGHPLGRLCQEGVLPVAQPLASRPQRLRIVINFCAR